MELIKGDQKINSSCCHSPLIRPTLVFRHVDYELHPLECCPVLQPQPPCSRGQLELSGGGVGYELVLLVPPLVILLS